MWIFLVMLFAAAALQTAALLSLPGRRFRPVPPLLLGAAVFAAWPLAVRINLRTLSELLNRPETLRAACAAVLAQSIVALLLGLALLRQRRLGQRPTWYLYAGLLPPLLFPAGCFLGLVRVFNSGFQTGFGTQAAIFCAGTAAAIWLGAELLHRICRDEDGRIELVTTVYLLQIAAAMFLPAMLSVGPPPPDHAMPFRLESLIALPVLAAVVLAAAGVDFYFRRRRS